ncbi:putative flippase GtrA [Altererythrobacter atlanticus]|uniref:GtrA-like protein n=1 Tax=Croceibacterium atlanticum TaxID=1267766 RepID=A0A0F7KRT3_9SPHN|nr:GtrA family protein [Croceibacterium atlanticum]AKH43178.1 GtrA-like protein [Croceibacterium atlanticum]MBB5732117.1 putative flippase GtrA [Croceibacterium atlanticum]
MVARRRDAARMNQLFGHLRDTRLVRYLLASIGALAVDIGLYLALLAVGTWPAAAAAASYCAGILAHWLMSSRAVFTGQLAERGLPRARQKALFVGSALIGLAITTAIVWIGDVAGADPRVAKLVAIGASFTVTWLLRSRVVFRPFRPME